MAVTRRVGWPDNAETYDSKGVERNEQDVLLVHSSLVCGQNQSLSECNPSIPVKGRHSQSHPRAKSQL